MPSRRWLIREARQEDCPAVLELWREAETIPSSTDSLKELERLVSADTGLFLVAEVERRLRTKGARCITALAAVLESAVGTEAARFDAQRTIQLAETLAL